MNFASNFAIVLGGHWFTFGLGILNNILIARLLGPEGRGEYALLLNLAQIVAVLGSNGIYWGMTYWLGKDIKLLSGLVSNAVIHVLLVALLIVLLMPLIMITAPIWLPNVDSFGLFIILLGIPLLIWIECLRYLFLGQEATLEYAALPPFRVTVWLVANAVILVFFTRSVTGVILAWLIQLIATIGVFTIRLVRQYQPSFSPTWDLYQNTVKTGFRGLASFFAVSLMYDGDIYLLNHLSSLQALGHYSIATSMTRILQRSTNMAGALVFPVSAKDDTEKADFLTARIVRNLFLLNILLSVLAILLGRTVLVLLFGQEFTESYRLLLWLLPGFVANTGAIVIGPYLWGKGYPKIVILAPLASFIGNLLLDLLLVPHLGISGASFSSSMAYILWTALLVTYFVNDTDVSYSDLLFLKSSDLHGYYRLSKRAKQLLQRQK